MQSLIPLPEDDIRSANNILKSYEKINKDAEASTSTKITAFFLMKKGNGDFVFLKKGSLRAGWEGFKNRIGMFRGGRNRFDITVNLGSASAILTRALRQDDQESGDSTKKMYALCQQLQSLQNHVVESKTLKQLDVKKLKSVTIPIEKVKKPALTNIHMGVDVVKKGILSLFDSIEKLDDTLWNSLCICLNNFSDRSELFDLLNQLQSEPYSIDVQNQAKSHIRQALIEATAIASDEGVNAFIDINTVLFPEKIQLESAGESPTLQQMALAFGDSFVGESKFAGETVYNPFGSLVTSCLKERIPESEKNSKLQSLIENGITLSSTGLTEPKELRDTVFSQLKKQGKCILFGGWSGHAIVYEIEKNKNGKYSFRIYNEGAGSQYHSSFQKGYRKKVDGCIAVCEIDEKRMFKKSFFASLQMLTSWSKEGEKGLGGPADVLVGQLLPMLGGESEKIDPNVQRLVSPQRSGTCTYKSLLACLANNMTQRDYKLFKMEFKLFLLERYIPDLQKIASKNITTVEAHKETRESYSIIKRSIEQFAKSLENLSAILPSEKIVEAKKKIVLYQNMLKQMDAKVLQFESHNNLRSVGNVSQLVSLSITKSSDFKDISDMKTTDGDSIIAKFHQEDIVKIVQDIHNLPTPQDQNFQKKYELILQGIQKIVGREDVKKVLPDILDQLFKKIGSFKNIEKMNFEDAKMSFEAISQIANCLYTNLDKSSPSHQIMMLCLVRHLEQAYCQRTKTECLPKLPLQGRGSNIVCPNSIYFAKDIQCTDPFWVKLHDDLWLSSNNKYTNIFASVDFHEENSYTLNEHIATSVMDWYKDTRNEPLQKQVQESITRDRELQKREVEKLKNETQQQLDKKKQELTEKEQEWGKCKKSGDKSDIRDEIRSIERKINELQNTLSQAPHIVAKRPHHWPKQYVQPELSQTTAGNIYRAMFFLDDTKWKSQLGTQNNDVCVPEDFTTMLDWGVRTRHLFNYPEKQHNPIKQENFPRSLCNFDGKKIPGKCTFLLQKQSGFEREKTSHNQYASALPRDFLQFHNFLHTKMNSVLNDKEALAPFHVDTLIRDGDLWVHTLSPDIVQNLCSLVATPDMLVDSLLIFFSERHDLLFDNKWCQLFHSLLFRPEVLASAFNKTNDIPRLVGCIRDFFQQKIENALQVEDIVTAANLTWIAKNIQNYLDHSHRSSKIPSQMCVISDNELLRVFQVGMKEKFTASRPILLETILACSGNICSHIPQNEIEEQLFAYATIAHIMHQSHPTPQNTASSIRYRDAQNTSSQLIELSSEIKSRKEDLEKIEQVVTTQLPPILATMNSQFSSAKIQKKAPDVYTISDSQRRTISTFSITNGQCVFQDTQLLGVYDNELSESLLKKIKNEKVFGDPPTIPLDRLRCYVDRGTTYIKDPETECMLRVINNAIYIKTHVEGEEKWLLHRNYQSNEKELQRMEMNFVMRDGENGVYFCDPKTNKAVFQSTYSNNTISRLSDGARVVNIEPNSLFSRFESSDRILALANSDNDVLQEVQLARFNLTFQHEGTEWKCAEHAGWQLAPETEQFAPHIGSEVGYLVLKKGNQRKVLFPVLDPKKDFGNENKKSFNFEYNYDFEETSPAKKQYVECTLNGNKLVPNSLFARFHLARLYLETGCIDEAEELLFAHVAESTHQKFTEEEVQCLQAIVLKSASGDIAGRTIKIRLKALYLLEKNKMQFGFSQEKMQKEMKSQESEDEKAQQENTNIVVELIKDYLGKLKQISPLDPSQERILLQPFVDNDPLIEMRYNELSNLEFQLPDIQETAQYSPPSPNIQVGFMDYQSKPTIWARLKYFKARLTNTFPFDPHSVTSEELNKYGALLIAEVEKEKTFADITKNGFMQMSFVLGQSSDTKVKTLGLALYAYLYRQHAPSIQKNAQERFRKVASGKALVEPKPKISQSKIQYEMKALDSIETPSHEDIYIPGLVKSYLQEQNMGGVVESKGEELFKSEAPEVKKGTFIEEKFKQVQEDLQSTPSDENVYTVQSEKDLGAFRQEISQKLTQERTRLSEMEFQIVHSVSSTLMLASHFTFASKNRTLPSIQELCVLCSKKDFKSYAKKMYPELNDQGLDQLKNAVQKYLIEKQFAQHLERTIQQVDAVLEIDKKLLQIQSLDSEATKTLQITRETVLNTLGRFASAQRAYDLKHPYATQFLFIETVLNIKMRKDQIDNIEKFLTAVGEEKEIVLQMIMGAGKTSVLQPILGFLFADPNTLSVIDVPNALFEPVKDGLQRVLGSAFNQFIYTVPYERTQAKDITFLKNCLHTLMEVQERGGCLLRTPRVKYSILTSLSEAYHDKENKVDGAAERVELIAQIVELLELNEVVQMDEADMTMDPNVTFKFPVGEAGVIDTGRAELLTDFIGKALMDETMQELVSLDFCTAFKKRQDPNYQKKGAAMTKDLWDQKIKPHLTKLALEELSTKIEKMKNLSEEDKEKIRRFLIREEGKPSLNEIEQWIVQQFTESERHFLAVMGIAITKIFPSSFAKECGSHYGVDPQEGRYLARPYAAAQSPKVSSYGNPYQQLVYSAQMAFYYGVPRDAAKKMLGQLQHQARCAIADGENIQNTAAFKTFMQVMGDGPLQFSLLEQPISEKLIDAFTKGCSRDPKMIKEYLATFVFPQIRIYEQSVSATPQTLISSSKLKYGYTGTLHTGILSRTATAIAEKGTDGKTILAVQKKMESKVANTRVFQENAGSFPEQMIEAFCQDKDLDVFIDSGGWLKEVNMREYAAQLRQKTKDRGIEAIVYHNAKGVIVSLEPKQVGSDELVEVPIACSRYKTTEGKTLTLIAQRYETGTNIPQRPTAKAFMSMRKAMTKRDALQSVFRMRQILFGQSVSIALTNEVKEAMAFDLFEGLLSKPQFLQLFEQNNLTLENLLKATQELQLEPELQTALKEAFCAINEKDCLHFRDAFIQKFTPNSKDIWRYLTVNEALVEQNKNWEAAKHKMREVIEKPLRKLLSNVKIAPEVRSRAFRLFRDFLVQSSKDMPYTQFTSKAQFLTRHEAIQAQIEKSLQFYDKLEQDPEIKKLYDDNVRVPVDTQNQPRDVISQSLKDCVNEKEIPEKILIGQDSNDFEGELELEQETEHEIEVEVEQEREVEVQKIDAPLTEKKYTDLGIIAFSGYKIRDLLNREFDPLTARLPVSVKGILGNDPSISLSPNLFLQGGEIGTSGCAAYQLPGMYMLGMKNASGKEKFVFISARDAMLIKNGIYNSEGVKPAKVALFSFTGELVASTEKNETGGFDLDRVRKAGVIGKLCCPNSTFTRTDVEILQNKIVTNDEEKKNVCKLYEKNISYFPSAVSMYKKSPLRRFFYSKKAI